MAFALTHFKAYGKLHEGATRSHAEQICELHITAANTDTAYDLDNAAGTFWTAALADATYGALAGAAKTAFLTQIVAVKYRYLGVVSEHTESDYIRVLSGASGNQFICTVGGTVAHMPAYTFVSGSAPTAIVLVIKWMLVDGAEAITSDLGAAVTN